jgi:monomeric sarcosine oxidase
VKLFDLIVLGTGGVGSAALYHGARRGLACLGIDRFPPAHDRGSSHGESRLIRLSYFEHADYVPMLKRSYELWDKLDPELLHRSGVTYFGPLGGQIVEGVLDSARVHELKVDVLDPITVPHYLAPKGYTALFEAAAGWLPVERCVLEHLDQAVAAGAEHRWGESVVGWQVEGGGVKVTTDKETYRAGALVIAGGAWNAQLLPSFDLPLMVHRKHLHWFRCDDARYQSGFFFDLPHGQFYGFPVQNGRLKVAEHSGGEPVSDPLNCDRSPDPTDSRRVEAFVRDHLPGVTPERLDHKTCFYTRTPDDHFIVDRVPGHDNVAYAAGLSGHGFKFAPALGELLVDLATGETPGVEYRFLGQSRFRGEA